MTDSSDWAFPPAMQPRASEVQFDLQQALNSVVRVRTVILTIGYLITEAQQIWIGAHDGRELPGHALAYDYVTGFGLILPFGELKVPSLELGDSHQLLVDDMVTVIGHGGIEHALSSKLIAQREFAGYWEYLIEDSLLVAPPHPQWGGAALLDTGGKLVGIGSLLVQENVSGDQFDANLFVPIELLKPILDELLTTGKAQRPERPWLGLYTTEQGDQLVIVGVTSSGPAQQAQLQRDDIVTHVGSTPVNTLAAFYRVLWAQGTAGSMIALTIKRGKHNRVMRLRSASRDDYLLKPKAH